MSIQIDNGEFTRLHNDIFEKLALARFTASEYRCLMFLFRMTYGWHKKEDVISLSQWAKGTGLDPEKRHNVLRTLDGLITKHVIYSKQHGNNRPATWGFNKHFDQWDASLFNQTAIVGDNSSSVMTHDNSLDTSVITPDNTTVITDDSKTVITGDNHQRNKETIKESTEEEKTHARDPLTVAWQQAYAGNDIPEHLAEPLKNLAAECSIAAAIHGIKASAAKPDGRNFKYIAECARNYIPPAPSNSYREPTGRGPSYLVDIPGVVQMAPATNGHAPPPLPPPLEHDDPWAIALAELSGSLPGSAPHWLEGSYLEENGFVAGEPLYRVVLTNPRANAQWLTQQAEPAVRKKLASLLRKRILLEFVEAPQEASA